jgi:hypothetical protein
MSHDEDDAQGFRVRLKDTMIRIDALLGDQPSD